jgi:hypothetical protein
MVPDVRVLSSMKNEQKYPWLYDSVVHQGYLSKFQPTWPLLLKTEKVDEILIVFLLNYWANHGFKLC